LPGGHIGGAGFFYDERGCVCCEDGLLKYASAGFFVHRRSPDEFIPITNRRQDAILPHNHQRIELERSRAVSRFFDSELKNLRSLLLKAQRMAATRTEILILEKAA
jgi:hypothetical protein